MLKGIWRTSVLVALRVQKGGNTGMEWRIEPGRIANNRGYMVTIAEYTDSGHLTGAAVTLPCRGKLDDSPVSTEEAIRSLLRQVRLRIGEYLGYEAVRLSEN